MIVVLIAALAAAVTAAAILGRMYYKEKRTVIVLNRQLDLSYRAFAKQRRKLREVSTENDALKAENEELKHREERIKDFCRGASASTQNRQSVPLGGGLK